MSTSRRYGGWQYAPLRFVVWVLAFVLLGRMFYNNTLYDLRELTAVAVVARLASIGITLGFVYWNLFVMPPGILGFIWSMVGLSVLGLFIWKGIVDMGVEMAEDRDNIGRFHDRSYDVERTTYRQRAGTVPDGDSADD